MFNFFSSWKTEILTGFEILLGFGFICRHHCESLSKIVIHNSQLKLLYDNLFADHFAG